MFHDMFDTFLQPSVSIQMHILHVVDVLNPLETIRLVCQAIFCPLGAMFAGAAALEDRNPGPVELVDEPNPEPPAGTSALVWTATLSDAEAAVVAKALRAAERAEAKVQGQGWQPPAQPRNGPVVKPSKAVMKRPAGSPAGSQARANVKKRPARACKGRRTKAQHQLRRAEAVVLKRPAAASH